MSILLAPDASPWQEVNEDTQCFDVFARNDDSVENNETFYIRIVGHDDCVDVCSAESAIIIHEDSDGNIINNLPLLLTVVSPSCQYFFCV